MSDERNWQNGFGRYKDSLSAIQTWKDGYGGSHVLDYRDLGEEANDGGRWECSYCGNGDPHNAIVVSGVEIDVTCENVYITPTNGGDGFAFSHSSFEDILRHYLTSIAEVNDGDE